MGIIIPRLCENGSRFFMRDILKELRKRGMNIKVIGFDPWCDLKSEDERIVKILNL